MFDDLWVELGASLKPVFADYRRRLPSLNVTEKADQTLLTEADLVVESLIIEHIRAFDSSAMIIAEESGKSAWRPEADGAPDWLWVIDPIDGTAEFVRPDRSEFCCVVCVLYKQEPVAAFVFAPELGLHGKPLEITVDRDQGRIRVNSTSFEREAGTPPGQRASVTRSSGTVPRYFEGVLQRAGYRLKTKTTSQTLDMVRTAVDIASTSRDALPPFDLFYRESQKIWDGLAGLCLGVTSGLAISDGVGAKRLPVSAPILAQAEPMFESTLMGTPEAVKWFLEIIHPDN